MRAIIYLVSLFVMINITLSGLVSTSSENGILIASDGSGTRAGEVGWQYENFSQNLHVNVTPESITTDDQMVVTITSIIPEVWIKQAAIFGVVYPTNGVQFPFSFPFQKVSDTVFECIIEPFPLNGYRIDFYIVAYDYLFSPMDSRTSTTFSYEVKGTGWQYKTFDENVELTYSPQPVHPSHSVVVRLCSTSNITIYYAQLSFSCHFINETTLYYNMTFNKTNEKSTEMECHIPMYPAGSKIYFYVRANDKFGSVIVSTQKQYTVIDVENPEIFHEPIIQADVFRDIEIVADVTDQVGLANISLCYLPVNSTNYTVTHMSAVAGLVNTYSSIILAQSHLGQVKYNISAIDLSGNFNNTTCFTINIVDRTPPVISILHHIHADNNTMLIIRANVKDDLEIESVILNYRMTTESTWISRSMANVNGSQFEFTIPSQANQGIYILYYYVNATDSSGNLISSLSDAYMGEATLFGIESPNNEDGSEDNDIPDDTTDTAPNPSKSLLIAMLIIVCISVALTIILFVQRRK